jgi:diacylglycerol kinase family enzyme
MPSTWRDGRWRKASNRSSPPGGDGTIHEVVNGIAGSEAALGLMPMGTMNVFANELGLPANDLGRCWEIIRAERTRLIDLPTANGKHFVQLAGVGLTRRL